MLMATDHYKLKYDKSYTTGDFAAMMKTRFGSTNELRAALTDYSTPSTRNPCVRPVPIA